MTYLWSAHQRLAVSNAGASGEYRVCSREFAGWPYSTGGMRLAQVLEPFVSKSASTHYVMPRRELLELLETTRTEDALPRRLRVRIDRRTQTKPQRPEKHRAEA
jgi:hypothetical protein